MLGGRAVLFKDFLALNLRGGGGRGKRKEDLGVVVLLLGRLK